MKLSFIFLKWLIFLLYVCITTRITEVCDAKRRVKSKKEYPPTKILRQFSNAGFLILGRSTIAEDDSSIESAIKEVSPSDCGIKRPTNYIVGGEESEQNEFPFIVSLQYNGQHFCSATIINEWWILTAAHCFIFTLIEQYFIEMALPLFSVIAATHEYSSGEHYSISRIIINNKFNVSDYWDSTTNDIALIRVNREIKFNSRVNAICLPAKPHEEPIPDSVLTVAGWGVQRYGDLIGSKVLRKIDLTIISDQQCSSTYSKIETAIYHSYLCAHSIGKSFCSGDSGGPAFQYMNGRAVLLGIASFSHECKYPAIFMQISYFLDWIISNVN